MKSVLKSLIRYGYLPLSLLYSELVLQLWCFGSLPARSALYISLFSLAAAFAATLVASIRPGRFFRAAVTVFLVLIFLLYGTQAVYYRIFKAFLALNSVGRAGEVLTSFRREALSGIARSAPALLLLLPPLVLWAVFGRRLSPEGITLRCRAALSALFLAFQCCGTALALSDDSGVMSVSYLYSEARVPELSVRYFGALVNLRQDLVSVLSGGSEETLAESTPTPSASPGQTATPAPEATASPEETAAPVEYGDNVLEIDFASLISGETDERIAALHEFFAEAEPSSKNEYTGLWEGKNLIWIVAEGFSTWAIDENLTPTLYRLSRSGFVFENFYNPLWYVSTSDGEFTTLLSLLPRSGVWSMSRSSGDTMPFGMGNLLSPLGYGCYAFHNGYAGYYDRNLSHPNLGYSFFAGDTGLSVTDVWPPSDLEMIQNSFSMYSGGTPFHTYYMTISGHMYYTFSGNSMAAKHRDEVSSLPYSDNARAYVACNMELDLALEELINDLDEAGLLEDTAIVLSGDHYPYGLELSEIEELNGAPVETNFDLYRSTLIMWCADMEEPVYVEKPCYSLDILPTICNLMGLDFDSRLIMGRDILSDSEPLVIFGNRSFITGLGSYNAATDTFTPAGDAVWETEDAQSAYARELMQRVNEMFSVSADIIDYDYYSTIFKEGN